MVRLHPLCAENYDRLLVRSKPGVRLLIVLVDEDSKARLLQNYAAVILPYSRFCCLALVLLLKMVLVKHFNSYFTVLKIFCSTFTSSLL